MRRALSQRDLRNPARIATSSATNIDRMASPHRTRDHGAELDDDTVVDRDGLGDAALITGHLRLEPGEAGFSQSVGSDVLRQRMILEQRSRSAQIGASPMCSSLRPELA